MPKLLTLILIFICIASTADCQDVKLDTAAKSTSSTVNTDDVVFTKVEQEAEFPGGVEAWTAYVQRKMKLNPAKKGAPPGRYQVIIRFIILKDGSISNAEAETNYGYGMEKEVLKVIQSGPKWIPAQQNGRVVNAYRRQPVTFIVEKE